MQWICFLIIFLYSQLIFTFVFQKLLFLYADGEIAKDNGSLEFAGKEVHLNEHQTNVGHVALCYQGLAIGDSDNAALSVLQHVLGIYF